jgi:hypothetical protein
MNTNELITMVDLYFDNELEKSKEPVMFIQLSQDYEAREYFKKMNALKTSVSDTMQEFPSRLDEKILKTIGAINEKRASFFWNKKVFATISFAATVILLALTIFFYSKSEEYKVQFVDLTREIKEQNDKLELLMNALPQVEVKGGYVQTKQITVRPKS